MKPRKEICLISHTKNYNHSSTPTSMSVPRSELFYHHFDLTVRSPKIIGSHSMVSKKSYPNFKRNRLFLSPREITEQRLRIDKERSSRLNLNSRDLSHALDLKKKIIIRDSCKSESTNLIIDNTELISPKKLFVHNSEKTLEKQIASIYKNSNVMNDSKLLEEISNDYEHSNFN